MNFLGMFDGVLDAWYKGPLTDEVLKKSSWEVHMYSISQQVEWCWMEMKHPFIHSAVGQ